MKLEKYLDCENEELVIEGFIDRYNVSEEEAKEIFLETKKWLWLADQCIKKEGFNLFIDGPLLIIDEMWHTFILYTSVYTKFCKKQFNKFIHHHPTSKKEQAERDKLIKENKAANPYEESIEKQYSLIYDYLGAETLLKWYEVIPQKYTPSYIKQIRKY
ncbi:hypothetical protein LVD15_25780 [Fulvivirga maritima]|uniref:hypothetical protein n=1 Tax=Fulvivirga maritima TaxID=2904247 RepID=UPI001F1633C3|nr:hypothetical protein [Fulvivirga maritima]UII26665.1 hypothetical protein LVD15_25780 [Fulvivirga maritima]